MVRKVQNISVSMPSLSNVKGRNYIDEYPIAPVHAKAKALVSNHQITNIAILQHDNGVGSTAATASSKCILKAIENAIEN